MHISVEHHALHGLTVLKTAGGAEEEARLNREAAVLAQVAVPGLIELIDHDDTAGRPALRTRHVGTRNALTLGDTSPRAVARLGAGLATSLAQLHERGLSHNAVDASHVLIGPQGEPVLCGLGHVGGDAAVWAGRIELDASGPGFDPDGDVEALRELLTSLAERSSGWRDAWSCYRLRRALAATPTAQPSAAALAAALAPVAGTRHLAPPNAATDEEADDPLDPPTRSFGPSPTAAAARGARATGRRKVLAVAGVAVIAGAMAAAIAGGGTQGAAQAGAEPPAPVGPDLGARTSPSSSTPGGDIGAGAIAAAGRAATGSTPSPGCPTDHAQAATGVSAACAAEVRVLDGAVSLGELSWELGEAGDAISVSDVGCDGDLEVVLLRPGSGELFVFERWAPPEGPVTIEPARTFSGKTAVRAGEDGCGLVLSGTDGSEATVGPEDLA